MIGFDLWSLANVAAKVSCTRIRVNGMFNALVWFFYFDLRAMSNEVWVSALLFLLLIEWRLCIDGVFWQNQSVFAFQNKTCPFLWLGICMCVDHLLLRVTYIKNGTPLLSKQEVCVQHYFHVRWCAYRYTVKRRMSPVELQLLIFRNTGVHTRQLSYRLIFAICQFKGFVYNIKVNAWKKSM